MMNLTNYFVITNFDIIPPIQNDKRLHSNPGDSTGPVLNGCG